MWNGKAAFYKWAGVTVTDDDNPDPNQPPALPGTVEAKIDALTVELAALRADVKKLTWLGKDA
jgi:hypothetical protein